MEEETKKEEDAKEEEIGEEIAAEEVKDEAPAVQPPQDEKPLEKMTTPELKEIAFGIPGVTGVTAMKKDQLVALIKEYRGIKDEEPKKKKKAAIKEGQSIGDLKQKVVKLRESKELARGEKDKKKVKILRRRINRLKKRTRKIVRV